MEGWRLACLFGNVSRCLKGWLVHSRCLIHAWYVNEKKSTLEALWSGRSGLKSWLCHEPPRGPRLTFCRPGGLEDPPREVSGGQREVTYITP